MDLQLLIKSNHFDKHNSFKAPTWGGGGRGGRVCDYSLPTVMTDQGIVVPGKGTDKLPTQTLFLLLSLFFHRKIFVIQKLSYFLSLSIMIALFYTF